MAAEKIKRSQYEKLKRNYLSKNRSMHSLYIELNEECEITRQLFFKLINKIRQEEGLNEFYTKKKKRKSSKIINGDKAPHHYNN